MSRHAHWWRAVRHRYLAASSANRDNGFTLIELLIVLVILPLIIGGIATAVIAELDNTSQSDPQGTYVRLADSHDTQITSAYFVRDVQSASAVSTNTSTSLCPTGGSAQLLGLSWKVGATPVSVSYATSASAPFTLVRRYCQGSNPEVDSIISHQVFPKSLSSITLTNSSGTCAAGVSSCAINSGTSYVSITVNCTDGGVTCANSGPIPVVPATTGGVGISSVHISVLDNLVTRYQYGITGVPRLANSVGTGQPPSVPPNPPLISNGPIQAGNCNILSNGWAVSNATNGTALNVGPTGSLDASDFYSAGGSESGSGYYPTPVINGGPIPSPYLYLSEATPPAAPPPPGPPVGASYTVIPETAHNWDPSTLPQPLAPAIYWVQDGLDVSGNKGVDASNGVLFYVTGGSVTLGGKGNIGLSPLSPNWEQTTNGSPAPLPEVVLWISQYDKTPNPPALTLGGNGGAVTVNGAIYAPTAAATINGGGSSGGISTQALDVGTISACNGGGSVPFNLSVGSQLTSGTFDRPTTGTDSTIALGTSETATVTVTGAGHLAPTGTVSVSVCGPEPAPPTGCGQVPAPSGQPAPVLVPGASALPLTPNTTTGTATATSPAFTPTLPGWYCFMASYPGNVSYDPSSDTSPNGCFDVAGPPTVAITSPAKLSCYSANPNPGCVPGTWPNSISGIAADVGGPGIQSVAVTIQDPKGNYWNGTSFSSATAFPLPASSTDGWATWSIGFPAAFTTKGSYTITATATDNSNVTSLPATVAFTWK